MHSLSKMYLFLYIFYSYVGYNFIYRLTTNKKIDFAIIDYRGYSFIGKRLLMLSHLTFLYNIKFIEYPNPNRYLNIQILNFIVCSGYFIKWGIIEKSTFLFHVFWSLIIMFYSNSIFKISDVFNIRIDQENLDFITFMAMYFLNYNKIYTPRLRNIDND